MWKSWIYETKCLGFLDHNTRISLHNFSYELLFNTHGTSRTMCDSAKISSASKNIFCFQNCSKLMVLNGNSYISAHSLSMDSERETTMSNRARKLESLLAAKLTEFLESDVVYALRRVLAAEITQLYRGPQEGKKVDNTQVEMVSIFCRRPRPRDKIFCKNLLLCNLLQENQLQ